MFLAVKLVPASLKKSRFIRAIYAFVDEYILNLPLKLYYLKVDFLSHGRKRLVLCYPDKPAYNYTLYNICRFGGYKFTDQPRQADCIIYFQDTTYRRLDPYVRSLNRLQRVINYKSRDISKKMVGKVQKQIFNYSLEVDPQTYRGRFLKKSNLNSTVKGVILDRPEQADGDYVYQKIVDNVKNGNASDLRVPVFGDQIPFVYLINSPEKDRFNDQNYQIRIVETESVFSSEEIAQILKFCRILGFDYGELDILRDNNSNQIYIVDTNNTPVGPSNRLPLSEKIRALRLLTQSFSSAFLTGIVLSYNYIGEMQNSYLTAAI